MDPDEFYLANLELGRIVKHPAAYETDLAYVHDQGYGDFARGSAPGVLGLLDQAGIEDGCVVDLGCGSGIWARELVDAGFQVVGVDISPAMIEIARRRVSEAEFHVESFLKFRIPPSRAVTALGEVFNYLFDSDNSLRSLQDRCASIFDVLPSGGLLIFDVAEPGRNRGLKQHDEARRQLSRRIITFRKVGDVYRRHEETHCQQLFDESNVTQMLESIGFQVRPVRSYGKYPLADRVVGFVARKP